MFSNLFFLILVLLIVNIAPDVNSHYWTSSPHVAVGWGLGLYCLTLALIGFQNYLLKSYRSHSFLLKLANGELLFFLIIFLFFFSAQRILATFFAFEEIRFAISIFMLTFYLLGLAVFHYTYKKGNPHTRMQEVSRQLRILIPFVFPFLLFTFLFDLAGYIPIEGVSEILSGQQESWTSELIVLGLTFVFMGLMMVFLPFLIRHIWKCQPISDNILRERLEKICQLANFHHSGLLTWTVMNPSFTAAIIGIVPRYRYVMFTTKLLHALPPEEIEAILAHEIAHSKLKHLLFYPLILLGMILAANLLAPPISNALVQFLIDVGLNDSSPLWESVGPIVLLVSYVLVLGLYFRFVFGYFSRLFERQADLYVFKLGLPADHMVNALHQVATLSGNIHRHPSWHHFSIQQRIDFLNAAIHNPNKVKDHDFRVYGSLFLYCLALIVGMAYSLII